MSGSQIPIATLKERVRIDKRIETALPEGGTEVSFLALSTVWARIHARPAVFQLMGDARAGAATHMAVVRRRTDLTPGDRLVWGNRILEILWVEDLEGNKRYTSCGCMEARGIG